MLNSTKHFPACSRGSFAVNFALAALPLFMAAGAALDMSRAYHARSQLQESLDQAVLAIASESSLPQAQRLETGNSFFNASAEAPCEVTPSFRFNESDNEVTGEAYCLIKTSLLGVFGQSELSIGARATAVWGRQWGACVIALDPNSAASFRVKGLGTVSVPNCGIQVNSTSSTALLQEGSGWVRAASVSISGNYQGANISPAPLIRQPAIADPLESVPEPAMPSGCTFQDRVFTGAVRLPAGSVYCGKISFNGQAVFATGIHYFKGASVTTAANASVSAAGVMLYFDKTSSFTKSSGNGSFNISAMPEGVYRGIAIFASRSGMPGAQSFIFSGGKDYVVNGTIYLPKGLFEMYGTVDMTASPKSGYVISWRFSYDGNSNFVMDTFGGVSAIASRLTQVRLVR
jgi:hypothetical protein